MMLYDAIWCNNYDAIVMQYDAIMMQYDAVNTIL